MLEKLSHSKSEYINALVDIGNIYLIENNLKKALKYLHKAHKYDPYNPKVRLALHRLSQKIQSDQRIFNL